MDKILIQEKAYEIGSLKPTNYIAKKGVRSDLLASFSLITSETYANNQLVSESKVTLNPDAVRFSIVPSPKFGEEDELPSIPFSLIAVTSGTNEEYTYTPIYTAVVTKDNPKLTLPILQAIASAQLLGVKDVFLAFPSTKNYTFGSNNYYLFNSNGELLAYLNILIISRSDSSTGSLTDLQLLPLTNSLLGFRVPNNIKGVDFVLLILNPLLKDINQIMITDSLEGNNIAFKALASYPVKATTYVLAYLNYGENNYSSYSFTIPANNTISLSIEIPGVQLLHSLRIVNINTSDTSYIYPLYTDMKEDIKGIIWNTTVKTLKETNAVYNIQFGYLNSNLEFVRDVSLQISMQNTAEQRFEIGKVVSDKTNLIKLDAALSATVFLDNSILGRGRKWDADLQTYVPLTNIYQIPSYKEQAILRIEINNA